MISGRHRHKLIDGLVIAMGKPSGGGKPFGKPEEDEPEAEKPPVDEEETETETEAPPVGASTDGDEPDAEAGEEDSEAIQCAKDAARAAGLPEMNDVKARSFVEAIRTIAGGYSK